MQMPENLFLILFTLLIKAFDCWCDLDLRDSGNDNCLGCQTNYKVLHFTVSCDTLVENKSHHNSGLIYVLTIVKIHILTESMQNMLVPNAFCSIHVTFSSDFLYNNIPAGMQEGHHDHPPGIMSNSNGLYQYLCGQLYQGFYKIVQVIHIYFTDVCSEGSNW